MTTRARSRITLAGIRSVFRKELIQLMRDPYLVAFIITLPIMQLLVTGLAISKELRHVPMVVCNYDKRNGSFELLKAFNNSPYFEIDDANYVSSEDALNRKIRQGKFRIGVTIPPDYSSRLMSGSGPAQVDITVDGTHANIAKSIHASALLVIERHTRQLMNAQSIVSGSLARSESGGLSAAVIQPRSKILYNPDLQSSYFLIPGILAIIMHMMTILFTSFAIVRERENGTLEQLMSTPIRVADLMIGKVIPYAVIGLLDMMLTLGVMVWFFHISISGSFWFLILASIIFIVTSLAIGLLISTTCRSQVQAVQLTLALLLPSLLISGFVFPLEPMPWVIKAFSYSLPLTYYLDIIRGVVIKGIGLLELWQPLLALVALSSGLLALCIARFKKQIA
ncbi:MAG: ABC transporter permease [Vampirovibrionales bacterium]|nr:ABC transporter permease [Vampirovibrionales bacterium]